MVRAELSQAPGLFEESSIALSEGAVVLRGHALPVDGALLGHIAAISAQAPFRHLVTPGGREMSVAMTNSGRMGWVSDRSGYRYQETDPLSGQPWPAMPAEFLALARGAAAQAGYADFRPDGCLINRYAPGAALSLHQDRDEHDLRSPIVSVSLGLPATFLWGGATRAQRTSKVPLFHGDVVVWGGPARLTYHGVAKLLAGSHPLTGALRYNITFRHSQ